MRLPWANAGVSLACLNWKVQKYEVGCFSQKQRHQVGIATLDDPPITSARKLTNLLLRDVERDALRGRRGLPCKRVQIQMFEAVLRREARSKRGLARGRVADDNDAGPDPRSARLESRDMDRDVRSDSEPVDTEAWGLRPSEPQNNPESRSQILKIRSEISLR